MTMTASKVHLPQSFISKKRKILDQLSLPVSQYDDLSPKGSVDEGVRDLIDEINQFGGCVTTSSCSGRISIFLEGKKNIEGDNSERTERNEDGEVETRAGVGGKGGGGRWLYVSHEPLDWRKHGSSLTEFLGMSRTSSELRRALSSTDPGWERWVHLKFEPMILHILTASLEQAQMVLSAALQAGFRESGATNLISAKKEPATPMVAVRSMGLAFESFVGYGHESTTPPICMVSEETLECLVDIANKRFKENTERIDRFRRLLKNLSIKDSGEMKRNGQDGEKWEDPEARRERKRAEGLMKSRRMEDGSKSKGSYVAEEALDLQLLDQNP